MKLSFATGSPAHQRFRSAPIAKMPAMAGVQARPKRRQPAFAAGPKLKPIHLGAMMAKPKPFTGTQSKFMPNPQKTVAKFELKGV